MNSQETLWFIGKCLSLAVHPERASEIQKTLQSGKVNWESLVYQSSNQLVLPALYHNLRRNNLLAFLPADLVDHLENITQQNRARNHKVLNQIHYITRLLNENGIKPIFLKGSAHLQEGLYEDIGERMLSDIDFLLNEKEANKAWQLLVDSGYQKHNEISVTKFGFHRHLIELIKENEVASVEIHTKILENNFHLHLNYEHLVSELIELSEKKAYAPSIKHQILYNILNAQSNDKAHKEPKVLLRNSYDILLLSQKENLLKVVKDFSYTFDIINNYLAISADLLSYPKRLTFERTKKSEKYVRKIQWIWEHPNQANLLGKIKFIGLRIYRYSSQFLLFFINSNVRKRIIKSLSNRDYYKTHLAMYKKWFT